MTEEGSFDIATKSIYWMVAGFVILMLMMGFLFIVGNYKAQLLHIPEELQAEFISLRFTNIPECFAYQDPLSGRVYPGVIDLGKSSEDDPGKFTEEQMQKCYPVPEENGYKELNFELELRELGKKIKSSDYYRVAAFTQERKVKVKEGNEFKSDTLIIRTQTGLLNPPSKK